MFSEVEHLLVQFPVIPKLGRFFVKTVKAIKISVQSLKDRLCVNKLDILTASYKTPDSWLSLSHVFFRAASGTIDVETAKL